TQGARGMWGSHALVGDLTPEDKCTRNEHGVSIAELLTRVGGDVESLADAVWPTDRIGAYFELHIEQGPILEQLGVEVGVVEAITGRVAVTVVVRGRSNHAGTTPMELRRDAMAAASRLVLAVEDLASQERMVRVATVGHCVVEPNAWNVIPGVVRLSVDLRAVTVQELEAGVTRMRAISAEVARSTGTQIEVTSEHRVDPVSCDPGLRQLIKDSADLLGVSCHALPSGAGHDAQIVGKVAPVGMIFVPSKGGVSHVPAEATDPEHLVAGADVLLHTVLNWCDSFASQGEA
ncbi:Zn-dependent hydrolase, partial [Amycolatopsis lurida]|uniref:Zn-dependent hydrolase n=1 Tax=Amycolatopsis lurida TaxID=31959 RepID=UPI00365B639B